MKAVRFHSYGGPEVLSSDEVAAPTPSDGEALVRVGACGVNHVDLDLRAGTSRYPLTLPHTLGLEVAGEVAALGPGASGPAVGSRVLVPFGLSCGKCRPCVLGRDNFCTDRIMAGITRPGGYAEFLLFPADALIPLPDSLTFADGAATLVAFGTAWHMLVTRAGLQAGETVLVQAASSGVGSAAIQIARFAGARVIATAGSDQKLEQARALGAQQAINYSSEDFVARVMDLTDGAGVDVVVEYVGGDVFTRSLKCLAPYGRLVSCGGHAGEVASIDLIELFRKEIMVIGSRRASRSEMERAIGLLAQGAFHAVIDEVLPLDGAAEAHRRLANRQHFGKLVLVP